MGRRKLTENEKKLNQIKRIIKSADSSLARVLMLLDEKPENYKSDIISILKSMDQSWAAYDEYDKYILGILFSPLYYDDIQPLLRESGLLNQELPNAVDEG